MSKIVENVRVTVGITLLSPAEAMPEYTIVESLTSFAAHGVGSSAQAQRALSYSSLNSLTAERRLEKNEAERRDKQQADEEKQAKRKADDEARIAQLERDIRIKTFDAPTFRCQDECITFAGALDISRDGRAQGENQRIPRRSHARPPTIPNIRDLPHPSTPGGITARILHPTAIVVVFNSRSPRSHPPPLLHFYSSSRPKRTSFFHDINMPPSRNSNAYLNPSHIASSSSSSSSSSYRQAA
ncbi:hypothetical protein PAXRUDRAFT_17136 [Paxillus rubicundulus Ve08.2h10]|uniref:Uncharacterized protein n=1 Tax=Paxillus rubicundulus Ve08.2h10 TaxID=930991 RepID=A0A0D0DIR4_9AGAM|nr:hypothetical protein PAXRUDRAFT_17136 [Paxillus rubicundulus Ve08.2h10]